MFMDSSIALNARIRQGQTCVSRLPGFSASADASGMTSEDEKIGQVVKELIRRTGMTQAEFAEKAGLDPGNLTRIIKGKQSAPTARLRAIGRVCGVSSWEILRMAEQGLEPEREPDPRKAALHALVDSIDPSQIDSAFRRWLVADEEHQPQQYGQAAKEAPKSKSKAG
jgi:transcriptional regulator with XRE-family HTH domain